MSSLCEITTVAPIVWLLLGLFGLVVFIGMIFNAYMFAVTRKSNANQSSEHKTVHCNLTLH